MRTRGGGANQRPRGRLLSYTLAAVALCIVAFLGRQAWRLREAVSVANDYNLALAYRSGIEGMPRDHAKAIQLFERAANDPVGWVTPFVRSFGHVD